MKKTSFILATLSLLCVVLNACSKTNTNPLYFPAQSEIGTICVTNTSETFVKTDSAWISEFIEQANAAQYTSRQSIQDFPNSREYIQIDLILNNGNESTLYVYQEKRKWYLEQPYQGIYLVDDTFVGMLTAK